MVYYIIVPMKKIINFGAKMSKDVLFMNKVIKSNSYIPMNDKLFHIPVPCSFEVLNEDSVLWRCIINNDRSVCIKNVFNPCFRRETPITFTDIHYFFKSRIDPRSMNPAAENDTYSIVRATHGILPYDKMWIRFDGENISYKQLTESENRKHDEPYKEPDEDKISEILHQHLVDVDKISHETGADNGQD